MSLLPNLGSIGSGSSNFYKGVATTSLRCDSASNPKLVLDGTSGDRKTWTWSCWVKRSSLGSAQIVFNVGVTGTDEIDFHFTAADQFIISDRGGHNLKTAQLFRDTSAWYNLVVVMDTVQSGVTFSSANALKLYVNGVRVTDFASGTSLPDENDSFSVNHTRIHHIATRNLGDNDFDGYLADMNLIDGTAIGETSGYLDEFGELKNGVWIPKDTSGLTFGNNGFRLQFKQTGLGTGADDTIGADTGGGNHDFDSTGIAASDCAMPDSPENNFCTLNVLDKRGTVTVSEGNLKAVNKVQGNITATIAPTSGKWYWEAYLNDHTNPYIGVQSIDTTGSNASGYSQDAVALNNTGDVYYDTTDQSIDGSPGWANTNIISVAYDVDNNKIWWALNGQFYSANASSESTIAYSVVEAGNNAYDLSSQITHGVAFLGSSADDGIVTMNFGQDASFAGVLTGTDVGDETDGNGNGLFKYAPPSGYLSLCTANLEEPTIGANSTTQADDYFGISLYSGDNSVLSISDLNFQPDLVWIKRRNADGHGQMWQDSTRGSSKYLNSTTTGAEGNKDWFRSFDDDGFTVSRSTTGGETTSEWNTSGGTYVGWSWIANGNNKTSFSESGNNPAGTHQANQTAGFSIVSYTGTGSAGTVAHGLGVAPSMIIAKALGTPNSSARSWFVYHRDLGASAFMYLDLVNAQVTSNTSVWGGVTPSTTVFSLGNEPSVNFDAENYIAYCFAEVEGYSKFGSYTGNSSDDGAFVFLGFKPAWVMIKSSSATSDFTPWTIYDNKRKTFNDDVGVNSNPLYANHDVKEGERGNGTTDISGNGNSLDFLSNGFKCRDNANEINQTNAYIYMAFAEQPFKYANAE